MSGLGSIPLRSSGMNSRPLTSSISPATNAAIGGRDGPAGLPLQLLLAVHVFFGGGGLSRVTRGG